MNTPRRSSPRRSSHPVARLLGGLVVTVMLGAIVVMFMYPDKAREVLSSGSIGEVSVTMPKIDPHNGRSHYLEAVDPRDEQVRELAIKLTRRCKAGDRGCEASRLLRYVASKIKYVSDPRGDGDHVQPPMRTVELKAGDCEDQTILLASLFEAVGIRTLLAFTENHVYAMACTKEPIRRGKGYLGRGAKVYAVDGGALHCYPAEPTSPKAKLGQEADHDGFLLVADPVDGSTHDFSRAPDPD